MKSLHTILPTRLFCFLCSLIILGSAAVVARNQAVTAPEPCACDEILNQAAGREPASQHLTLEWVYGSEGRGVARVPSFAWLDDGSVVIYDGRLPAVQRSFERLDPAAGSRKAMVDAVRALADLKSAAPGVDTSEGLPWPLAFDGTGRQALYLFNGDVFVLDLVGARFRRLTSTASEEKSASFSPDGHCVAYVEERITGVLERQGGMLDVLINNAGNIKKLRWLPNTNPEDLESLFRVHCVGALRCTRAVLPFLRRSEKPLIINLTSRWGSIGRTVAGQFRGIYSYQIAKCAQNMLTACLDHELKEQGIRVAAVHPGKLKTQSGAVDADIPPEQAAARLVDWVQSFDRAQGCRCHDLMSGGQLEW